MHAAQLALKNVQNTNMDPKTAVGILIKFFKKIIEALDFLLFALVIPKESHPSYFIRGSNQA